MSLRRAVAMCATWNGHTMTNIFLLIILVWSVGHMTEAQQFEHKKSLKANLNDQQELTSSSAAVIQANDKRLRNVNGVTNPNGGAVPPPVQRTPLSDPDMDNESLDNSRNSENEGYMREVKAIIGGVLGFWGGVGGLGTVFLVVVLTQRHCCKEDGGKDDADG